MFSIYRLVEPNRSLLPLSKPVEGNRMDQVQLRTKPKKMEFMQRCGITVEKQKKKKRKKQQQQKFFFQELKLNF